ncbi:hypothetical protein Tco_0110408 [Tanacetum coccineum]
MSATTAGPRKTLQMFTSLAIKSAKRYFTKDMLELRKYLSDYRLEAMAAAQQLARNLIEKGKLITVDNLKLFAEMVVVRISIQHTRGTSSHELGSSWAMEVGNDMKVYPVTVENVDDVLGRHSFS